jgi:hypothetical protein
MKYQIVSLMCCCMLAPLTLITNERTSRASPPVMLTPDQAIAAVRKRVPNTETSFEIVRVIHADAQTREVAQRARLEAASHHIDVRDNYPLLNLLEAGGFLILAIDSATHNALSLYLVSSGAHGGAAVERLPHFDGKVEGSLAKELIAKNADFVDSIYDTPLSDVNNIKSKSEKGRFPEYDDLFGFSFFATPHRLRNINPDESATQELAGLYGAYWFWMTRYVISLPVYAASPDSAQEMAQQKKDSLVKEILRGHNKGANFINDFEDLVRDRIAWFRRLDDFLEPALQSRCASPTFAVNKSFSTIALELDTKGDDGEIGVLTAPEVTVVWRRGSNGDWVVTLIVSGGESLLDIHRRVAARIRPPHPARPG